ncbi:hypothetical protein D3C73_1371860 [compost metagenome]
MRLRSASFFWLLLSWSNMSSMATTGNRAMVRAHRAWLVKAMSGNRTVCNRLSLPNTGTFIRMLA